MGHYYDTDGNPVYEVPNQSKGGMRPTTVVDARKMDLYPSVTTILSILDRPMLNQWKTNKLLEAAVRRPFSYDLVLDDKHIHDWKKGILHDSKKETDAAASLGNRVHDALEHYYSKGTIPKTKEGLIMSPYIESVSELLNHHFGNMSWITEKSFGHKSGFGGKVDLHSGVSRGIVVDFKTKSTDDFSKVKAYDDHAIQLAAYREGLGFPQAECYNIFVSTKNPKDIFLHKWDETKLTRAWGMFHHLLQYWKVANRMD